VAPAFVLPRLLAVGGPGRAAGRIRAPVLSVTIDSQTESTTTSTAASIGCTN
jgi:hypothetical protein